MKRKWLLGMALPVVASLAGLASCSSGTTSTTSPTTAFAVLRLTTTGAVDGSFAGGRGIALTHIDPAQFDYALAVAIQPADNKIIAGGSSGLAGQGSIGLVRYNTDGSLDTTFNGTGIVKTAVPSVASSAAAVAVQPDGKILVAAITFNATTGNTGIALLRYNTNGTLDTAGFAAPTGYVIAAIGPGNATDTCALALQADGNIVVAGASSTGDVVLYRYDGTGTLDTNNFGTTGTGGQSLKNIGALAGPPAIAFQSSGKIIVATGNDADQVVLRFGTDGVLDTTFGGGGTGMAVTNAGGVDYANAVAVQQIAGNPAASDKIVVAGHANFTSTTSDISLVRYNSDGTPDPTFGNNGIVTTDLAARFDNALSLALQSQAPAEPLVVVSGNAGFNGFPQMAVLRYNNNGSLDPSFGPAPGGVVLVNIAGPSNIASGNAVALQPVGSGVGIVVAGYD
jgi:uncharacterized delta-60 repeat protein